MVIKAKRFWAEFRCVDFFYTAKHIHSLLCPQTHYLCVIFVFTDVYHWPDETDHNMIGIGCSCIFLNGHWTQRRSVSCVQLSTLTSAFIFSFSSCGETCKNNSPNSGELLRTMFPPGPDVFYTDVKHSRSLFSSDTRTPHSYRRLQVCQGGHRGCVCVMFVETSSLL